MSITGKGRERSQPVYTSHLREETTRVQPAPGWLAHGLHFTPAGQSIGKAVRRAKMGEQQNSGTVQAGQTGAQWPVNGVMLGEASSLSGGPAETREEGTRPLTLLTLDTVLTAGDLQRILKIVSSS